MGGIGVMNCGAWDDGGAVVDSGACWLWLVIGAWGCGGGVAEGLIVCLSCVESGGGGAVLCGV